jgi:hypothetical protein
MEEKWMDGWMGGSSNPPSTDRTHKFSPFSISSISSYFFKKRIRKREAIGA